MKKLFLFASLLVCLSASAQFSMVTDTNGVLSKGGTSPRNTNFFQTNMVRLLAALTNDTFFREWFVNNSTDFSSVIPKKIATNWVLLTPTVVAPNIVDFANPTVFAGDGTDIGDSFTVTNKAGAAFTVIRLAHSDKENGIAGFAITFGGQTYWTLAANTNDFSIEGPDSLTLLSMSGSYLYLGSAGVSIYPLGNIVGGAYTGSIFDGTNVVKSRFFYPSGANATLVNGANGGILLGTNQFVALSGATTIAQINGLAASTEGDLREISFSGAVTNVIVNEADAVWSTDATAANRIVTGTGSALYLTNSPSWIRARYNGSRWIVLQHSR